ncbi:ribose-phosphate diphosphokinase [Paucilactobacillus wasatchensis]|uniref:Putative ribose-phosphate pyrophosphokinase n=1 Tax=Paucilactobacillus wasatchensis TaxID=1335616 RepID=A0A0D1A5B2_9LACO|nr:ribose-phosphate diphosphokinase [Paucilactobacillus wasatchensis]KIS03050.1 Ribose-phosphate pyrophosphokinase [Paucilactobacillus wasatchensis]
MTEIKNAANVKLFTLNSNRPLAQAIAEQINIPLSDATIKQFADGEIQISIDESVRGCEIYVIQSISDPVNSTLMELLIMIDALRRASAKTINVILPYYGYARQDRKARSREPITAKLIATLLEMDRADRVVTLDLHAAQVQGFFNIPVDHLLAAPLLANYFYANDLTDNIVVVAPDHAGVTRARKFAEILKAPIAIIDNRNPEEIERKTEQVPEYVIGDVTGKTAIIIDDIIDTGVRMAVSATAIKNFGAKRVFACATHAVFSGDAMTKIDDSAIEKMIVTDSINMPNEKKSDKLIQLSVAPLFAAAIAHVHNNEPVDSLFISSDNTSAHI